MKEKIHGKERGKQPFYGRKNPDGGSSFVEKKCNPWMWGILFVTLLVISIPVLDKNFLKDCFTFVLNIFNAPAEQVMSTMRKGKEFLGTFVMTLFSVMAAFLVLCYGSLGYTNYGLSNRKIIGYTIGSLFLPFLVMMDAIAIVGMLIGYYVENCVLFYVSAAYTCLLLAVLVSLSVYSTSKEKAFKTIKEVECKQYENMCRILTNANNTIRVIDDDGMICPDQPDDSEQSGHSDLVYLVEEESNINKTIYHSRIILESGESLTDKLSILKKILLIPFETETENNRVCQHFYLYQNMFYLTDYITWHYADAKYIYSVLYEIISSLYQRNRGLKDETKKADVMESGECVLVYMGAVFYAMIPLLNAESKKTELPQMAGDIYAFFGYIFNHIIQDEKLRALLLLEYLHALMFLQYQNKIDLDCEKLVDEMAEFVDRITLDDRDAPKEEIDILRRIECSWLANTTEMKETYWVMAYTEDNIYRAGVIPAVNFLYQLKWDYV